MKHGKILAIVSAFSLTSMIMTSTAAYSLQHSVSDIVELKNALHRVDVLSDGDDFNADGTVNVVDLHNLKNQIIADSNADTGVVSDSSYAATTDYVKLQGRNYIDGDITWLVQSGSAAEFIVTANSAEVELAGNIGIGSSVDYQPRYAVYVDDELLTDATLGTESLTVPLWQGDTSRTGKVKVILLSEAMYGGVGVRSINVSSSAAVPVRPMAANDLRIEFIGDSITCAYGVEGASSSESFKTTTENFTKSYAYLTAKQLNADYSVCSYSGHGIVSGYSSGDKNADSLIPDYYEITSKHYSQPWDFTALPSDVVVINLGTNDINYVTADSESRSDEFVQGYIDFLTSVRKNNPDAYIICTLGTMGGNDSICPLIEQAVTQFKSETGEERIMYYESITQSQADGYGSDWHPSPVTQQNSAYVLADKICQALGMESSQIGLDMASDATYEMVIDPDSGANASHYVGYDKSFWINMVIGGAEPSAIEARLSGIALKEGGEYRLSFDYTTSLDKEVPVLVRGTDTYFSDTVSGTSASQSYEAEFTVKSSDNDAMIVFQIGGLDYYNVTLKNIKLVKIK
ncbi:MAG: hypothetical protein IJO29_02815 [Oscillospiraceae bacterium]|nr:hypothetical protein [Oscillospiraceae bacterium]